MPQDWRTSCCLLMLGCPKNQVDSERMLAALEAAGYRLVADPQQAAVLLVNTCAFIEDAVRESVDQILELAQLKQAGRSRSLIVTGCLAERYGGELLKEIPEIDALLGPGQLSRLPELVSKVTAGERGMAWIGCFEPEPDRPIRVPTGSPHSAYVKIAEGCDHRCSFCLIPRLRGPQRSRRLEAIGEEVLELASEGVEEVILIAQDTTAYGRDLPDRPSLAALLRHLEGLTEGPRWIRVLYTHPKHWTDELIELYAGAARLIPYVDMPIQHASDRLLKAMGRGHTRAALETLLRALRTRIPNLILRTTVLLGHPGEREEDLTSLLRFLEEFPFDRLGAFAYSPVDGTRAYAIPHPVPRARAEARREQVLELQRGQAVFLQQRRKGQECDLLIEGVHRDQGYATARSYGEAPGIDGIVYYKAPDLVRAGCVEPGDWVWARMIGAGAYDLVAVPASRDRGE